MRPKWIGGREYNDRYRGNTEIIVLDRKCHKFELLIASKWYKPLKLYFYCRELSWKAIRYAVRHADRKRWIKANPSEIICLSTLWKWFKAARG